MRSARTRGAPGSAPTSRREGVTVIGPRRGRTATILTFLDAEGERTFVTDRAAALSLLSTDLPDPLWADVDVLHIPAYSLFEGSLADTATIAARRAQERNRTVTVDLSSVSLLRAYGPARFAALLAGLRPAVLFANLEEAQAVFAVETAEAAAAAMRTVARKPWSSNRGAGGILVVSAAGQWRSAPRRTRSIRPVQVTPSPPLFSSTSCGTMTRKRAPGPPSGWPAQSCKASARGHRCGWPNRETP